VRIHYILTILLLTTALQAQNDALGWAVAGQAADLVSTEIALLHGATELNPLMVHQPVRLAAKVGLSVVFVVYAKKHPENKRAMTIFAVLSWLPVIFNVMQEIK